jgi:ATP-dependent helicase/nuclease subunit B
MKLIYSESYEGRLYYKSSFNNRFVGPTKLLNLLERELGLYKSFATEEERLKLFVDCLIEHSTDSFYNDSLQSDQYRVGKELLKLRDELILAGWNNEILKQPSRLDKLAEVDADFKKRIGFEGVSDRWVKILNTLNDFDNLSMDFDIVVHDDITLIYPIIRKIFDCLNVTVEPIDFSVLGNNNLSKLKTALFQSFNKIDSKQFIDYEVNPFEQDQSLLILKFANKQLLVDTIASISNPEEFILLANDALELDLSMVSFGKNAIGSEQKNSNPQLVQLFKLIIPCFSQFNIHSFISFLQLKDSPIPYDLRIKLLNNLIEIPGFGNEKWNNIINDFKNGKIVNDLDDKKRNEIVNLFLSFESITDDEKVVKAKKIVTYLKNWAIVNALNKQNQYIKEQFHYLNDLFVKLDKLIHDVTNLIAIEHAFNIVYESSNFTNYIKQENSVLCLNHLGNVASDCENIAIITDFYGSVNSKDLTKLLIQEEQEFLKQNNCFYNSYDQLIFSILLRGLNKINKQLILCYFEDDKTEKHPFLIRMETLFSDLESTILHKIEVTDDLKKINQWSSMQLPIISSNQIGLPKGVDYLEFEELKKLEKREVESASSIEKFIQYPFDWVLEYKLKMSAYQGIQLGRENQLKGKIAHKVIENIFSQWINETIENDKISSDEFEKEFIQVVQQEGVLFLQPEKRFELEEFKSKFKKSFFNLVKILIQNELAIESCEYAFGKDETFYLEEIDSNLIGFIDLVLKNKNGIYVVFDLKWTYSDKKYKEKIENNEEIQLALYTAALKDRTNTITGYFLLNQNKLFTTAALVGDNVVQISSENTTAHVLSKIEKSVQYRWNEIQSGKLEIGDGMSQDLLAYSKETDLIQFPIKDKMKEPSKYSNFDLFKGKLN